MSEHPIQGLMRTALESLKAMVDVNTVVGDPIETTDGQVIVPISRVSLGFVAGGTEFAGRGAGAAGRDGYSDGGEQWGDGGGGGGSQFPFGGGSGAGVSVQPVGFLIVTRDSIRMLPVEGGRATVDKLMELAPRVLERLTGGRGQQDGKAGGDPGEARRRRDGEAEAVGARAAGRGREDERQGQDGEQGAETRQTAGRLVRRLVRDLTERGGQDGGHGQ